MSDQEATVGIFSFIQNGHANVSSSPYPSSSTYINLPFTSSLKASQSDSLEYTTATATDTTTELYVVMAILSVLSVVGTGGNALVLYVFSQKNDRLVSTLCIVVMAAVDLVTCLVVIPYTLYMEGVSFHVDSDIVCKLYQFLITSNIPFSALIMVAIAVDRYFCICRPFARVLNETRAKAMITLLGLFAAALGLCVALMYGVYQKISPPTDPPDINSTSDFNMTSHTSWSTNAYSPSDSDDIWHIAISSSTSSLTFQQPDPVLHSVLNGIDSKDVYDDVRGGDVSYRLNDEAPNFGNGSPGHTVNYVGTEPWIVKTSTLPVLTNTGMCDTTDLILGCEFRSMFQKLYSTLFLVCLIIVIILYALIYRTVLVRRARRQSQQSKSLSLVVALTTAAKTSRRHDSVDQAAEESTLFSAVVEPDDVTVNNGGCAGGVRGGVGGRGKRRRESSVTEGEGGPCGGRRASNRRDLNRMANVKTAAMLFVVTVVFIVTYLPAFLMALGLVPYNMTVFYMYFANNVANPVIYSFMNQKFRDDTRRLFSRR